VAAYQAQPLLRSRRIVWFDAHPVVDGKAQFLFAAQVPFRRLDRDMSKEELAAAAKIMRRECFNSGAHNR